MKTVEEYLKQFPNASLAQYKEYCDTYKSKEMEIRQTSKERYEKWLESMEGKWFVINFNNENIVKCKCGAVFEYEKSDLLFAKTELSNPFYDLSVRCPKCFNFISVHDNRDVFPISEFDEIINKNFRDGELVDHSVGSTDREKLPANIAQMLYR